MFGSWRKRKENPVLVTQQTNSFTNNVSSHNSSTEHNKEEKKPESQNIAIKTEIEPPSISLSPTEALNEEYERKIRVLSQCLSEKAEENITIQERIIKQERRIESLSKDVENAKELEVVVTELNSVLREKNQEFDNYKDDINQKEKERIELHQLTQEFQRRIRVLSTCLEDMAQENLGLHSCPKKQTKSGKHKKKMEQQQKEEQDGDVIHLLPVQKNSVEAKLVELTRKQDQERIDEERIALEQELANIREDLINIEEKLQKKDKRISQLNIKLMDAVNKKNSLSESNDLYEEKLKILERELTDNLQQESIRRQEAEYIASKLRKKEGELQFLLDDRDQDSDPYYSEDDSE